MSLSWQCCAKSFIYLKFSLNQTNIAKTLCENRTKPKSCCAGKCVLEKELKKEDKRQSDLPSSIKEKNEKAEIFSGSISYQVFQTSILQDMKFGSFKSELKTAILLVFRPPCI